MKYLLVALSLAALVACTPPPKPMSQAEIDNAVYWDQMAYTCVAKGYVTNISAMSTYRSSWSNALNSRANPARTSSARDANFKKFDWSSLPIENCRTLELTAVGEANQLAQRQRQAAVANSSAGNFVVQPYQPMYTSCYSATGMCVSY